ncbi:protein of unknown function [Agreia sp. COWG]|nr:protein of unknown function [Agreia sp. COWG]
MLLWSPPSPHLPQLRTHRRDRGRRGRVVGPQDRGPAWFQPPRARGRHLRLLQLVRAHARQLITRPRNAVPAWILALFTVFTYNTIV